MSKAIIVDSLDNVATTATDLKAGSTVKFRFGSKKKVKLNQAIPFGHKFAIEKITKGEKVIKITGTPRTYETMKDNMDINAGTIIKGKETIEEVGHRISDGILNVASGKKTKAEVLGHNEFAIFRDRGHPY